jgi:putative oxidoreductase
MPAGVDVVFRAVARPMLNFAGKEKFMSTHSISFPESHAGSATWQGIEVLCGRLLFSLIFILSSFGNFSQGTIAYAAHQGVPAAGVLVPVAGVLALLGGLSILFGYHARIGALLLMLFLIPVSFMMHNFWSIADPAAAQMQQVQFMKNMGLLGGALLIGYFGAGPWSVDARRRISL